MTETATAIDFPAELLDRAEYEIRRYGDIGFQAMTNDVYLNYRTSPHADALMAGIDAIGWANRIKYRTREKALEGWRWVMKNDYGEDRPWFAMPDNAEKALTG